jgi:hypothetical protein
MGISEPALTVGCERSEALIEPRYCRFTDSLLARRTLTRSQLKSKVCARLPYSQTGPKAPKQVPVGANHEKSKRLVSGRTTTHWVVDSNLTPIEP